MALLSDFAFFTGAFAGFAGVFAMAFGSTAFGVGVTAFEVDVVARAPADSPFAASLSVLTALSRALAAAVIAVSALASAFADVPARVAAMFSLAVADVTRVAAAETVRGVTVAGPLPVVLPPVVLPPAALPAFVLLALARVLVLLVPFAARPTAAGLAVAPVAGFLALPVVPVVPVVPGSVAAVFVGTDLHPHLGQLRGWHSTESNALHLITGKKGEVAGTKHYRKLLFGLRQQFTHDPQRLLW